jgi:hypothetical protein
MKKLKILLGLSLIIIIAFSCENDEVNEKIISQNLSLENLKKDSRTVEYLKVNKDLLKKIKDISKVQELSSKENLNNSELQELSIALGFKSYNEYINYYRNQTLLLKSLENDYKISTYNEEDIEKALFVNNKNVASKTSSACMQRCSRTANNCLGASTAAAVLGHTGCLALDVTIVGGIVCHAAILAGQYFVQDECLNQSQQCYEKCLAGTGD